MPEEAAILAVLNHGWLKRLLDQQDIDGVDRGSVSIRRGSIDQLGDPPFAHKSSVADRPACPVKDKKPRVGFRDLAHTLNSRLLAARPEKKRCWRCHHGDMDSKVAFLTYL